MNQRDKDITWIKLFLGSAFVRGVSIKGRVATIVVVGEGGIERQTIISLPNIMS